MAVWDHALAEVFFDGRYAMRPVYLDLDEVALAEVARSVGVADDPAGKLVQCVTEVLDLERRRWLRPAVVRLERWRAQGGGGIDDVPPVLAVLAVLVLAAERMRAGDDMSSRNYYGRLTQDVLGVPAHRRDHIAHGYREHAPVLFDALNVWLAACEGARGLPTARPGGLVDRYVYYAVSQALLREGDRDRLTRFFAYHGLSAGTVVSVPDMSRLLVEHASRSVNTLSHNLKRLIERGGETQQRIAALVADELQDWDGQIVGGSTTQSEGLSIRRLRLAATVGGFPRPSLRLSLVVNGDEQESSTWSCADETATIFGGAEGSLSDIGDGWALVETPSQPAWGAGLARRLTITADAEELTREPSRLVVMRHEPALSRWVEVERVVAGEDSLVLVVDDFAPEVERALEEAARPGWRRLDLTGVPEGWTVFSDVQIMGGFTSRHSDLSALVPAAESSLSFGNGLRLPEQPRRWHRQVPPELRLSLADEAEVWVHLHLTRGMGRSLDKPLTLGPVPGVAAVSLTTQDLPPGDYTVRVTKTADDQERGLVITGTMRLRDGDLLAVSRIGQDPLDLGHAVETVGARGVGATELSNGSTAALRGAATDGTPGPSKTANDVDVAEAPGWVLARHEDMGSDVVEASVSVEPPPCFLHGGHYFELGLAKRGPKMTDGVCKYCDKREYYPTRGVKKGEWANRRKELLDALTVSRPLEGVGGIEEVELSSDVVLDALTHLRDGSIAQLQTVLRSGLDALQAHALLRSLEALGHVEVERDVRLDAKRWRVSPPTLSVLPGETDGAATVVLCGARSEALLGAIRSAAGVTGLELRRERQPQAAPTRITLTGPRPDLERLVERVNEDGHQLSLTEDAINRALALMAPMSLVLESLHRTSPPSRVALRRLDLQRLAWQPVDAISTPGVYRIDLGFRAIHAVRTSEDLTQGRIRVGPQEVVKHAAVVALGRRPYVAHRDSELIAPSHVGLPGLLERAAVLCSGFVAEERTNGQRAYRDVPSDVARQIAHRLTT